MRAHSPTRGRPARMPVRSADELRDAIEAYLGGLPLAPELGRLEETVRYALDSGGKRIRPVLCLAVADAAGGSVEAALPAAAAVELVHTFSLVHDDLPALDDDDERRGRPSTHVAFGEGVALLAGDALLAEALRLALTYERPEPARELVEATLGMIGGQYRDITGDDSDLEEPSSAEDGAVVLRFGRARALGSAGCRRTGRRCGGRSATSSASSFRPSTTSSTATASQRRWEPRVHGVSPTRPPSEPSRVFPESLQKHRFFQNW